MTNETQNQNEATSSGSLDVRVEPMVMHLVFDIWNDNPNNFLVGTVLADGDKISIMDRLTGWGDGDIRDVETGYRAKDGKFWLASGQFDIREYPNLTVRDAIQKIKDSANTCIEA